MNRGSSKDAQINLSRGECACEGWSNSERCNSKGCTNQAQNGGVFRMRGAKVKLCILPMMSEECASSKSQTMQD